MAINLKGTSMYLNKYEGAHDILSSQAKFGFNDQTWRDIVTGVDFGAFGGTNDSINLDMYIDALSKSDDFNLERMKRVYNTDFQDRKTELMALFNEAYPDTKNMVEVTMFDDNGQEVTKKISNYEYNIQLIRETNDLLERQQIGDVTKELLAADAASVLSRIYTGADKFYANYITFVGTILDPRTWGKEDENGIRGWNEVWNDYGSEFVDERGNKGVFTTGDNLFFKWLIESGMLGTEPGEVPDWLKDENGEVVSIQKHLAEFETEYTHFRDADGNLTTPGRLFVNAAETAGEMAAASVLATPGNTLLQSLTGGAAAAGVISEKTASTVMRIGNRVISSGIYYAPLAGASLEETYKSFVAQGVSAPTGQMLTHQLVKTGAEIGIEALLDVILGPTGLSKWLFGSTKSVGLAKVRSLLKKNKYLSYFGNIGFDMLQEGTEEVLQELSDVSIDNVYGAFVNDKYGELSEFSWQNLTDAFTISTLVSAGHAAVSTGYGTLATPGRIIKDADGNIKTLNKFSAYVADNVDVTIQGLINDYETAQSRLIKSLIDVQSIASFSEELDSLKIERENLISRRNAINADITGSKEGRKVTDTTVGPPLDLEAIERQLSDVGGISAMQTRSTDIAVDRARVIGELDSKIADIDSQIAQLESKIKSEMTLNKNGQSSVKQYLEDFKGVLAAAQMIQSFCNFIGEERIINATKILEKMNQYIQSSVIDADAINRDFDDMMSTLRISGVVINANLKERMRAAKISKLNSVKKIDKKTDEVKDAVPSDKPSDAATESVKRQIDELLTNTTVSNVVITDDGNEVVSDEDTLVTPTSILSKGAYEVFKSDAESRLVYKVKTGNFGGRVLETIFETYKQVNNRLDATMEDAIYSILFDMNFYRTVLLGDGSNIPLADRDMYKFLSSLYELSSSLVPRDVRNATFNKTLNDVRKNMAEVITEYLMYQPNVSEYPSFLNKTQIDEIRKMSESYNVYNRLISHSQENPAPNSDWEFIAHKINSLQLVTEQKNALMKRLRNGKPVDRRKVFEIIDNNYRRMYNGSYDGKIYLPLNSLKNRSFNQYLYSRNGTVKDVLSAAKVSDSPQEFVKSLSDNLSSFTNGRFELRITKAKISPESGIFGDDELRLEVIDVKAPSGYKTISESGFESLTKGKNKTVVYAEKSHADIIRILTAGEVKSYADYYSIDDLITNFNLLKKDVQKAVKTKCGSLDVDSVYQYLKGYIEEISKGQTSISMKNDGTVVFVEVTPMHGIIKTDIKRVKNNSDLSEYLSTDVVEKCPFLKNCKVKISVDKSVYSDPYFVSGTDFRGRIVGYIYVPASILDKPNRIKFALAHETQHAIQYANRLALGVDADVLNLFDTNTKLKILEDIKSHVPELFNASKSVNESLKIANDFIYYCSGEIPAYGSQLSEAYDFYPNLVTSDGDKLSVTFPWGKTYTAESIGTVKQSLYVLDNDVLNPLIVERLEYGETFVEISQREMFDMFYESLNFVQDSGVRILADKAFKTFSEHLSDVEIQIYSHEAMTYEFGNGYDIPLGVANVAEKRLILDEYALRDSRYCSVNILHEVIHFLIEDSISEVKSVISPAAYSDYIDKGIESPEVTALDDYYKGGLTLIALHHELLSKASNEDVGRYGFSNEYEFTAELSNPEFRAYIKKQNFWSKILDAIKLLLGLKTKENILTIAETALEQIIDNFKGVSTIKRGSNDVKFRINKKSAESVNTTRRFLNLNDLNVEALSAAGTLIDDIDSRIKNGESAIQVTQRDAKILFDAFATKEVRGIGNKVFDVLEKFSSDTKVTILTKDEMRKILNLSNDAKVPAGRYKSDSGIYLVIDSIRNSRVGPIVILHECIHAVTVRAIHDVKTKLGKDLNAYLKYDLSGPNARQLDAYQLGALGIIKLHYELKNKASKEDSKRYGFKDEYEFVAELSNPEFRQYLKRQRLWTRLLNCIKKLLGIDVNPDALTAAEKSLEKILEFDSLDADKLADKSFLTFESNDDTSTETKDRGQSHVYKKGKTKRKRVGTKTSGALAAFKGRQISIPLQELIVMSDNEKYADINPTIKKKIKEGTLYPSDLTAWLYSASPDDDSDELTFQLLNEGYYHNKFIKSLKHLDEMIVDRTPKYYALRMIIRSYMHDNNLLRTVLNDQAFDGLVSIMLKDKEYNGKYNKEIESFESVVRLIDGKEDYSELYADVSGRYDSKFPIDNSRLRRMWMERYDGTIKSGGDIAGAAKVATDLVLRGKWERTVPKGNKKKFDKSKERYVLTDEEKSLLTGLLSVDKSDLLKNALKAKKIRELKEAMDRGESIPYGVKNILNAIDEEIDAMVRHRDFVALAKLYAENVEDETFGQSVYLQSLIRELGGDAQPENFEDFINDLNEADRNKEQVEGITRAKSNVRSNTERICREIRSYLSPRDRERFLKVNGALFTDDIRIRPELYRDVLPSINPNEMKQGVVRLKDVATLMEIEETARQILHDVKSGAYTDEKFLIYQKKYQNAMDRFNAAMEREARVKTRTRTVKKTEVVKEYVLSIVGRHIELNTTKNVPRVIQSLLTTKLEQYDRTKVQVLSNGDEKHLVMNYREFIDQNVEVLSGLTDGDVEEIIDFYKQSRIVSSDNDPNVETIYIVTQQILLGYLVEMNGKPSANFSLTAEQLDWVIESLKSPVSKAGTILANWKEILSKLNTPGLMIKSSAKICGIELDEVDEAELTMAINSGDIDKIRRAKSRVYNNLIVKYRNKRESFFDKFLRFERMALLSGPGTFVRNQGSNVGIVSVNRLAEQVSRILPKPKVDVAKKMVDKRVAAGELLASERQAAYKATKQYQIVGTQVSSDVVTWIDERVFKSGFYDEISDGLNKYSPTTHKTTTLESQLARIITYKLESELFGTLPQVKNFKQLKEYVKENIVVKDKNGKVIFQPSVGIEAFERTVQFMMSDEFFFKRDFKRYLGKMLTEDGTDLSQGLTDDVLNTIAEAYVMAAHDYMHKPNIITKLEHYARSYLRKRMNPVTADAVFFTYKQVFPFAGASWNWFVFSLSLSPLGLANGIIQFAKLENTINRIDDARRKGERVTSSRFAEYVAKRNIGRGVIGSVGWMVGLLLIMFKKVEFEDEDDKFRIKLLTDGAPIYVDISDAFGTTGIMMGMLFGQKFKDNNGRFDLATFSRVVTESFELMMRDSTFSEVINTFRYTDSVTDAALNLPLDTVSMMVPNFLKYTMGLFKKYEVAYDDGYIGRVERMAVQAIPLLSYPFAHKVDPFTGEDQITNNAWFWSNLINKTLPIDISRQRMSQAELEALSLNIHKSQLTCNYKVDGENVKLYADTVKTANVYYGSLNNKELHDLINNRVKYKVVNEDGKLIELTYSKMTEKEKAAVIERIMSNNSDLAKIYILTQNGYKYYASDAEFEKLRKAGIITNVYRQTDKVKGFKKVN